MFIRMVSTFYKPWTTSKIVVCNEENVAKTLYKLIPLLDTNYYYTNLNCFS